uniref:Uncharacterized protein n=1 Tax=Panagrolaimus sp. PS1159 TaxID=55785 RepID=A0AC35GJ19_9BILA
MIDFALKYSHGNRDIIEQAVKAYFIDLHHKKGGHDKDFKIDFKAKSSGSQAGVIASVTYAGGSTTFYVKTHWTGLATSYTPDIPPPDLKEIFIYEFLNNIDVCPEVHFVLPYAGTGNKAIYIATQSIPDFDDIYRFDKINPQGNTVPQILVQIHTLACLLRLSDLHKKNCGFVGNDLKIVDFTIGNDIVREKNIQCADPEGNVIATLENFFYHGKSGPALGTVASDNSEYENVYKQINQHDRRRFAKEALAKWNVLENVKDAAKSTNDFREKMKFAGVEFFAADFEEYQEEIKANYNILSNMLQY